MDVAFIAVGTPPGETGEADLSYVLAAAEQIGRSIGRYTVIVNKSTVPVGSADRVSEVVARVAQAPFDVVSNPEFLKEGAAIDDFMRPDRIVVGVASEKARAVMTELYAPFVRTEQPILFMDRRSSELTKYAANAMLATRISFMNDVASLCERVGADVDHVRRGMGSDRRIGYPFLFPGAGFGGSCFPKDVRALMTMARGVGLDFDLLRSVERVNERQKRTLLEKALKHFGSLQGLTFAVWGLAFKPKTDDMREAPSITIIEGLLGNGARVRAHDPVAVGGRGRHLRRADRALPRPLRRRRRGRRARARHRVERVPAARLRAAQADHEAAGALRRAQRLGPGQGPGAGVRLPGHRARLAGLIDGQPATLRRSPPASRPARTSRAGAPPPRPPRGRCGAPRRAPRGWRCATPVSETSAAATASASRPGTRMRATASARSRAPLSASLRRASSSTQRSRVETSAARAGGPPGG